MSIENTILLNENNLKTNPYPGRGIVLGCSPDGLDLVQIYWIMGRSENSRNRIFTEESGIVRTKPFDASKVQDPTLIIYNALRTFDQKHIVTNGDQTDTIYNALQSKKTLEDALFTREYEPDAPNFTPRISGITDLSRDGAMTFSILKKQENHPDGCQRNFFHYAKPLNGAGWCIHTYAADGNPLPSFNGEPELVKIPASLDTAAEYYWNLLNAENRISLAVKWINRKDGSFKIKIINKNK